jgi:hypothetical protein
MLDLAVAYNRYRFLGDEFLTWLWYVMEKDPDVLTAADPDCAALGVADRLVLENRKTKSVERITIKGDEAGLEEGRLALRKGALVAEMGLVFDTNQNQWRFSLKGESLNIGSLKTPGHVAPQSPEEFEGYLIEKADLINKIVVFIEKIFKTFIKSRVSPTWSTKTVPEIKNWMKSSDL